MPADPAAAPPADPAAEEVKRLFFAAVQLQNQGNIDGALEHYRKVLEIAPGMADAYNNIAVLLKQARRLPAAVACLKRAALCAPQSSSVFSNLGNLLWMVLEFEQAEAAFRRSLELEPDRPETLHNYGLLMFSLGNYQAAIDCYDRALAKRPNNLLIRWDRALARLASGDLTRGFAEYDTRFDLDDPTMRFDPKLRSVRSHALPLWQGEALAGRTLYVYFEQGFGDTLQFCRYLPLIAQQGARVIFDSQPELVRLLSCLQGVTVRGAGAPVPEADFQVPLMSVPGRFGVTSESLPRTTPYLAVPTADVPRLVRPAGTRLAVGVAWAGRPQHSNDLNRSAGLEHLLELCDLPGVTLYSLQIGPRTADIAASSAEMLVRDLSGQIRDFADTAALIAQLDLVVSVDTAIVHLAGALGKSCVVLVPFTPDWRWQRGRDDSPWYPSLRLFRQTTPRDWKGVMQRVRQAIAQAMAGMPGAR